MTSAAVFVLSLSSLAFEILLSRFFAVSQWSHLSFVVISIALFGFSAGGVALNIRLSLRAGVSARAGAPSGPEARMRLSLLLAAAGLSMAAAYLSVNVLPLDYIRLPFESAQAAYVFAAFLILSVPFFFTGLAISAAYAARPAHSGITYLASMAGSAAGALLPLLLLPVAETGRALILCGVLPLAAAVWTSWTAGDKRLLFAVTIVPACGTLLFAAFAPARTVDVRPSSYKALPQYLQHPETSVVRTAHRIDGRFDVIAGPSVRFAPGLSLSYTGDMPAQTTMTVDADSPTMYYSADPAARRFVRFTHSYAAYLLRASPASVLIVQTGGGTAPLYALEAGADEITVIDSLSERALRTRDHYGDYGVNVVKGSARAYFANARPDNTIVHIEMWGSTNPGMSSLDENYVLTVDAFSAALRSLSQDGVLTISRKTLLPPSDMLRVAATARDALSAIGAPSPHQHIAVLRNYDSYTLLVCRSPLREHETDVIRRFAEANRFDTTYLPGISEKEVNRYNIYPEPHHYRSLVTLLEAPAEEEASFVGNYLVNVTPPTDDKPYFSRFVRWRHLPALQKTTGGRGYQLLWSGEFLVIVVLAVAIVTAAGLLSVPFVVAAFKRRRVGDTPRHKASVAGRAPTPYGLSGVYFFLLGTGFMFVELALIKTMTLLTRHPVHAFTTVVAAMLVASGTGGRLSQRVGRRGLHTAIGASVFGVVTLLAAGSLAGSVLVSPAPVRIAVSAAVFSVVSVVLGMPFPLGMRLFPISAGGRAFGWAANGAGSVLASIGAAAIALSAGISFVYAAGAVSYAGALGIAVLMTRRGVRSA